MGKDLNIKMDDCIPEGMKRSVVERKITHDFVLEIYEKAKRARSEKKRQQYLAAAEELSKHIGKFLVK